MIIPAILESSVSQIQQKIDLIAPETNLIQIDILDKNFAEGKYLENKDSLSEIKTSKSLEVHLMSILIIPYIEMLTTNFDKICVHIEAEDLDSSILGSFLQKDKLVGISINPDSDILKLEPYLDIINYVQFMTVVPGKQGSRLSDSVLPKIHNFKQKYPKIRIQADGGINIDNIHKVLQSGVDDVVIGSAIFGAKDPIASLQDLQTAYGYN